jgi:Zn-dependent peptidase ImmA (M78 family)
MSANYQAAVDMAAAILLTYGGKYPGEAFPTIKGKLLPLIEARAIKNGVDNIYVKRFKERSMPIAGQVRRIRESNGVYQSVEQHAVIYLCPSLDLDWQRFVQTKEASHVVLDKPEDYVHSETDINDLLISFAQFGVKEASKQFHSEMRAIVCAIELLLPKAARDQLQERFDAGLISPTEIGRAARVPSFYVRMAMGDEYRKMVDPLYEVLNARTTEPSLKLIAK